MDTKIIEFLRKKDYELLEELGGGACAKTVLLNDSLINQKFVCKKYCPSDKKMQKLLFKRFMDEIKILHLLYDHNIVRVFNYYIYPDVYAGYILMEYIEGDDIENYLKKYPENLNDLFFQTISGFKYLEENDILHRDIRSTNIMVRKDGIVKIIDFGFGKHIIFPDDFDNSISLNWWCELPNEFLDKKYDFRTEVYFIGKLFKKIIIENRIESFQYNKLLNSMCQMNPLNRIGSFKEIYRKILNNRFIEIKFDEEEIKHYRDFSKALFDIISKVENGTKYYSDINIIHKNIDDLYKRVMLEEYLPSNSELIQCFINGSYYFSRKLTFSTHLVKSFLLLLQSCSPEKKNIIFSNLHSKLDSVERYEIKEEEIPF